MSKAKTNVKKLVKKLQPGPSQPLTDANADKQLGTGEQTVKVQAFLIVGIKGSTTGSKVAIESVEAGKALLKEIFVAISTGKPLFNEERGLVYNGTEISHAFLTLEQVK
jgi:hypothetical protein